MTTRPDWAREGQGWPNRSASRFVTSSGLAWHVQIMGAGPPVLLLHGTGAATHSYRGLAPLLAPGFTIIVPDLPGHGFTAMPVGRGLTLPAMARWVAQLIADLGLAPIAVAGHSAGAAIALRASLDGAFGTARIIGLNGALAPFPGLGAWLFPALARALMLNPFVSALAARQARKPGAVARLLANTGSHIDATGLECYERLLATERHAGAALAMMAAWDLAPLRADLPHLAAPVTLIASDGDRAVPATVSAEAAALIPGATLHRLSRLGHLAHEEDPALFATLIHEAIGA